MPLSARYDAAALLIGGFASSLLACAGVRDTLRAGPQDVVGNADRPPCCFAVCGFYDSLRSGNFH
jgi:hypothetical protein